MSRTAILTFALLLGSAAPALAWQFQAAPTNPDGSARFTDPDANPMPGGLSFQTSGSYGAGSTGFGWGDRDEQRAYRSFMGGERDGDLNFGPNYPSYIRR